MLVHVWPGKVMQWLRGESRRQMGSVQWLRGESRRQTRVGHQECQDGLLNKQKMAFRGGRSQLNLYITDLSFCLMSVAKKHWQPVMWLPNIIPALRIQNETLSKKSHRICKK